MPCICLLRLRNLLAGLLPLGNLATIHLPPAMAQLNAHVGSLGAPAGSAFNARLALSLPPLPLSLHMVEQISAAAMATETLTASLGFSPFAGSGPAGLSLTVNSLNLNLAGLLPLLPLAPSLPALTNLSLALSTIATLRATLGIDLLAPKVALRINALLGLPGIVAPPARINMAAAARAMAYAKLGAAATVFGGPANLLPSLRLVANLRLPVMQGHFSLLALLAALLGLQANLHALGFVNLSASAIANLRLALRPLAQLPPLALHAGAAAGVSGLPALNASFMANAQAIAALNLRAAMNLRLPNLAPLSMLASVAMAGGLAAPSACSSSCPVGHRL